MKNKYIYRSRILEWKFREILKLFCLDIEARKCSELCNTNRNTVNKIYNKIRELIYEDCEKNNPLGNGSIELDESYFGVRRVHGKRGRGAAGKISVFGIR